MVSLFYLFRIIENEKFYEDKSRNLFQKCKAKLLNVNKHKTIERKTSEEPNQMGTVNLQRETKNPLKVKKEETMPKTTTRTDRLQRRLRSRSF